MSDKFTLFQRHFHRIEKVDTRLKLLKYFVGRIRSMKSTSPTASQDRFFNRSRLRHSDLRIAGALIVAFVFGCTFEESLAPELIMKRVEEGNIPPHGTTRFAFSEPVVNDYVELVFSPDHGVGYHSYLTPDRDTLVLDISGMLPGKTTYTISPTSKITAESGGEIEPFGVSFTVTSHPTEDIGNNDSSTATPFEQPMYGSLENGYDSDCFVFTDTSSFLVRLTFEQGVTSWTIHDGKGTLIDERDIAVPRDSVRIDGSRRKPITLCLNPLMRAPDWYRIDTAPVD
jgi:hypothetical protein